MEDSLVIGVSFTNGEDGVLIVGRQKSDGTLEIINAFQDKEALDIYNKLITKKEK